MATTSNPYGLRPLNRVGGTAYAGATTQLPIASAYNTDIFYGDIVAVVAAGTIEKMTAVGTNAAPFTAGTIGVFMGCSYTDATQGFIQRQYWPAGTVASDAQAYIVDDPSVRFQIQADGQVPQTDLHQNMAINQTAGSTFDGNSAISLDIATKNTTATIAFKIVGFVDAPGSEVNDAFTDVIVKFNPSSHSMTNGTGI
jgi:hypothetical protein